MSDVVLRKVLVKAANGNPITADEAWSLIHKWDELVSHFDGCPIAQQEADPSWDRMTSLRGNRA